MALISRVRARAAPTWSDVGQQTDPLAPPGRRLADVATSFERNPVRGERWSSGVRGERSIM
jgi:hypothetical protein